MCNVLPTDPEEVYKLTDMISIRTTEFGTDARGKYSVAVLQCAEMLHTGSAEDTKNTRT